MKNLLLILTTILILCSCVGNEEIDVVAIPEIQKPYNPYFINQNEIKPNPIRYCGKDSIFFQGTRFMIDDTLSNLKYIEFRHIDTLVFIGDKKVMTNLKSLRFSATILKSLPTDLSEFKNLTSLTITKSGRLKPFPKSICSLKKLKYLSYSWGRNLDSIPDCISELKNLVSLDLTRNKISHFPNTISELTKLRTIVLWDNPISKEELERLQHLLPNTNIINTPPH
jgi:hypothetical protein